jgi:hypothetical protein
MRENTLETDSCAAATIRTSAIKENFGIIEAGM